MDTGYSPNQALNTSIFQTVCSSTGHNTLAADATERPCFCFLERGELLDYNLIDGLCNGTPKTKQNIFIRLSGELLSHLIQADE